MKCAINSVTHVQGKRESFALRLPADYPWKAAKAVYDCVEPILTPFDKSLVTRIIRSRDFDQIDGLGNSWSLQSIGAGVQDVPDPDSWAARILLGGLLKKFQVPGEQELRRDSAIAKFLEGEESCRRANQEIGRSVRLDPQALALMQQFCASVLGSVLPEQTKLTRTARHGPGSTTSTTRRNTTAFDKNVEWPYHCTAGASSHASELIRSDPRWLGALEASYRDKYRIPPWAILNWDHFWSSVIEIVPGNRITTVPKGRSIDRPIAIEPTLNLMLQLGVDGYVRKRLKRWGIDLDCQTKNQRLARIGSLSDDYMSPVTIDLASASDTISLRVCKLLLPREWYRYLCDIRSPRGVLPDGSMIRYRKISSMGNGTTFALESLIFASIAFAACKLKLGCWPRDLVGVFGDDLIVPKTCANTLVHLLETCGFSLNRDKSFLAGPSRESCGSDWTCGVPMRGVFLKDTPRTVPELYRDRNRLYRWLKIRGYDTRPLDQLYWKWVPGDLKQCIGPLSNEEFDTYWHSPICPVATDFSGSTELVKIMGYRKQAYPTDFLFGKLQATLRGKPPARFWDKRLSSSGTNAFLLPRGNIRHRVTTWTCYNYFVNYEET